MAYGEQYIPHACPGEKCLVCGRKLRIERMHKHFEKANKGLLERIAQGK